jgi:hypothetical protein
VPGRAQPSFVAAPVRRRPIDRRTTCTKTPCSTDPRSRCTCLLR